MAKTKNANNKKNCESVESSKNSKAVIDTKIEKKFSCSFCDKKFTRSEYVQGHISSVHFGVEINCDCGMSFVQKVGFVRHLSTTCSLLKDENPCTCCPSSSNGKPKICEKLVNKAFSRVYEKFLKKCKTPMTRPASSLTSNYINNNNTPNDTTKNYSLLI